MDAPDADEFAMLQEALLRRIPPRVVNEDDDAAAANDDDNERDKAIECGICLHVMQHAVTCVPCGHSFCARCVVEFWKSQHNAAACQCPNDRGTITMFIPAYAVRQHAAVAGVDQGDNREVDAALLEYNRFFSSVHANAGSASQFWQNLVLGWRSVSNMGVLPLLQRALIGCVLVLQLVYFLLPFDLLPEASLGLIGYLDDLIVILFLLVFIGSFIRTQNGG